MSTKSGTHFFIINETTPKETMLNDVGWVGMAGAVGYSGVLAGGMRVCGGWIY